MSRNNQNFIIERLIRNLSHELRNPLTALKGYAQLLGFEKSTREKIQRSQEMIINQVDRIESLLEAMSLIHRIDAGVQEAFDISPIINELLDNFIRANDKITINYDSESCFVRGDISHFRRIIDILISEFDWERNDNVSLSISTVSGDKQSSGALIINYFGVDFSILIDNVFYLPFSMKGYYIKGIELYEVYYLASLQGWTLDLLGKDDSYELKLEFNG